MQETTKSCVKCVILWSNFSFKKNLSSILFYKQVKDTISVSNTFENLSRFTLSTESLIITKSGQLKRKGKRDCKKNITLCQLWMKNCAGRLENV